MIHKDKFVVGDKVEFRTQEYASMVEHNLGYIGGKPIFTIAKVINRKNIHEEGADQSLWESMGHTQHVWIVEDIGISPSEYSGAFFKHVKGADNGKA